MGFTEMLKDGVSVGCESKQTVWWKPTGLPETRFNIYSDPPPWPPLIFHCLQENDVKVLKLNYRWKSSSKWTSKKGYPKTQKLFLGKCHSSSGVDFDTKAKGYTSNCHHVWPYDMHKAERYGRYDKLLSHKPGSLIPKKKQQLCYFSVLIRCTTAQLKQSSFSGSRAKEELP